MNARTICLTIGLVMATGTVWGQVEVEWERTYGANRFDRANSITQSRSDRLAFAGFTYGNRANFWFALLDQDGDTVSTRSYGGNENDLCRSLVETSDGGYAMGGFTFSYGSGHYDFWLVKTDSLGNRIWSKTYGGENLDVCNKIIQTTDNGYALAGYCEPTGDGTYDFLLIKTDENGDSLWSNTYKGAGNEACYDLLELDDGGFILAGYTGSYGAYGYDFWLVRTDERGDSLWSHTYGGEDFECCYSIIQPSTGGFALAGYTVSFNPGIYDYWLVRTNEDGDSLWSQHYGGEDTSVCKTIIEMDDGGFALSGNSKSFGAGDFDFWLVRTDSSGDSLWSQTFGGEEIELCYGMIVTQDGGFLLAGSTGYEFTDFYLVKTTPDPAFVREPPFSLYPSSFILSAYPNPFNSTTRINFTSPINRGATRLAVFDPLGRRVAELIPGSGDLSRRYPVGTQSVIWNATGFPAGQYIVRLDSGNQQLSQRLSLVR